MFPPPTGEAHRRLEPDATSVLGVTRRRQRRSRKTTHFYAPEQCQHFLFVRVFTERCAGVGCTTTSRSVRRRVPLLLSPAALASFFDDDPGNVTKPQRRRNKVGIQPGTGAARSPSTCGDDDRLNTLARARQGGSWFSNMAAAGRMPRAEVGAREFLITCPVSKQRHVTSPFFSVCRNHATPSFASAGCKNRGGE